MRVRVCVFVWVRLELGGHQLKRNPMHKAVNIVIWETIQKCFKMHKNSHTVYNPHRATGLSIF